MSITLTRGDIKVRVSANLEDRGVTFYSDADLNNSMQDGYNEIAAFCQCIIKNVPNINFLANNNYYDFANLTITDFLFPIGIFNQQSNLWLDDTLTLRDFDRLRYDWETWIGTPQYWAPHSFKYVAIVPKFLSIGSTAKLTLRYAAKAPTFIADGDIPLIAEDMKVLLEEYSTADLLESADEYTKASEYWESYETRRIRYKERCARLAKADILLRP